MPATRTTLVTVRIMSLLPTKRVSPRAAQCHPDFRRRSARHPGGYFGGETPGTSIRRRDAPALSQKVSCNRTFVSRPDRIANGDCHADPAVAPIVAPYVLFNP